MHWKVKLESDDNTLTQLTRSGNTPAAKVSRDGVDWFLESTDFDMISDHEQVKNRAAEILKSIVGAATTPAVGIGPIYRIHYDNSKTVFR